jgi:Fic family protein
VTNTATLRASVAKTHPWLTFTVDLRQAPTPLWVALGECQSKCEHLAGTPLRPETAKRLHSVYLAKGVLATTAIEGNTLSEEEVLKHLEGKLDVSPSREYLVQEIDNIVFACNWITRGIVQGKDLTLSRELLIELNAMVLKNLALPDNVQPGQIRRHQVGVARYRAPRAEDCPFLLERLFEWLNGETFRSKPGMEIVYATIRAIVAHLYLAWIHPFGDGNGRTARLVEFLILIASGVPTPACHVLSNHYNQTRTEYYRQLDAASKSGGAVMPFMQYAVTGFVDGLREQIRHVKQQQLDVVWRNYVHETFKDRDGAADQRKKRLVLDLSEKLEPVDLSQIVELSPRVALVYARKTRRTLLRDISELESMKLIVKADKGYTANKDLISAFLPIRKGGSKE